MTNKKGLRHLRKKLRRSNGRRRRRVRYVGKVGWVNKRTLGLKSGHFVFIRKIKKGGKCDVNTITSISMKNGHYALSKIKKIEDGIIYPIPRSDTTLPRFEGIDKRVIKDIPLSSVEFLSTHSIKKKHYPYILKHMK